MWQVNENLFCYMRTLERTYFGTEHIVYLDMWGWGQRKEYSAILMGRALVLRALCLLIRARSLEALCYVLERTRHFCLFDLILYVPSTIFHLNRDGSSWVEQVLS